MTGPAMPDERVCGRGRVTILVGDVLDRLAGIADDSVDCCVTSPPYWGLRDYGVEGQIGLEPTLAEHIERMVTVFREVRRVLAPTGTLWLNYGDCYATTPNGRSAEATKAAGGDDRTFRDKPFSTVGNGLKPKDLCMIPNRLAIALQDDGWWVRSECIWAKPNPMPDSSGATRPSTAHEKVFMLTKSDRVALWRARDTGTLSATPDLTERCPLVSDPSRDGPRWIGMDAYYDAGAVRVQRCTVDDPKMPDGWDTGSGAHGAFHRGGREQGKRKTDKRRGHVRRHAGFNDRWDTMTKAEQQANGRLLRNYEPAPLDVWGMSVAGFAGAHFATFPPELVERCLHAGCPPGGHVLDPFGGAGTTGLVAARHGYRATLIEISQPYAVMAQGRIDFEWGVRPAPPPVEAGGLFDGAVG